MFIGAPVSISIHWPTEFDQADQAPPFDVSSNLDPKWLFVNTEEYFLCAYGGLSTCVPSNEFAGHWQAAMAVLAANDTAPG